MRAPVSSPPTPAVGRRLDATFFLYNAALLVCLPLALLYLAKHQLSGRRWRGGWRDRLGGLPASPAGRPVLWAHAVSAGEAIALGAILRRVRALAPEAWIVVTTLTDTGQNVARAQCGQVADYIGYLPLDLLPLIARGVGRVRPDVLMLTETELWPNLLYLTGRRQARVVVVNGRISARNYRRLEGSTWGRLFGRLLARVDRFGMQTALYRDRVVALGAPAARTAVCGNAKLDSLLALNVGEKAELLRRDLGVGENEPLVVAGSTHPTEEAVVLEAFRRVVEQHPECRLLLAPRHTTRTDEVLGLVKAAGFTYGRRTAVTASGERPQVVLLDTMGELVAAYSLGVAAFVGGSLVTTVGGHNVLEPVACGKPVLYGPHMYGQAELEEVAREGGVGFVVYDSEGLAGEWHRFLSSPKLCEETAARGQEVLARHQGAALRYAQAVVEEMGG